MTNDSTDRIRETLRVMAQIGRCWSPSFSSDYQEIAFVSDLTGNPQVWRMSVTGGFPQRVTATDDQVQSVQWSPTGNWLAIQSAPGGGMNSQIDIVRPNGTDLRRLTSGGITNNWLSKWSKDGESILFLSNMDNADTMDSYRVTISSGKVDKLCDNNGVGFISDVTDDNQRILVSRVAYRGDNNVYLIDLEYSVEQNLTPHDPPGSFGNARFANEGKHVYLTSNRDTDLASLVRIDLKSPDDWTSVRAREDAELQEFALSHAEDVIALVWNIAGRNELELYNLATHEQLPVPEIPAEIIGDLHFSEDDSRLLMVLSGSNTPYDIYLLERETQTIRQLTNSPHVGVNLDALVRPTLETYTAHDGLTLTGWLYTPPEGNVPYPMVLSFHGGPEGQERPGFSYEYQALLKQGIAVFAPNVRGSGGFGKMFVNLDNGALRVNAVKDIESTVNHVLVSGLAQAGRIGIMGGSYGGYMTMAGLTEFPDLFAAGANLYGVVNFKTFFEHTEPWMAAISKIEYGDPETEGDMLDSLSPIFKLDRVTAPTLVLHGANDTNVPVHEAEQVVELLRMYNVPVEYILFPDEGHGFRKEANRLTSVTAIVEWFMRYLLPV